MSQAVDFSLCNAFTLSPYGGNPAATFFLEKLLSDTGAYKRVAATFNQPIATFILPDPEGTVGDGLSETVKRFSVRWFSPKFEAPLCGHGTIAAAYYMFSSGRIPPSVSKLVFQSKNGELQARKVQSVSASESDFQIEIELAGFDLVEVSDEEFERARSATAKALGKDDVKVSEVLKKKDGTGGTELYQLIVLDDDEKLSGLEVDLLAFVRLPLT